MNGKYKTEVFELFGSWYWKENVGFPVMFFFMEDVVHNNAFHLNSITKATSQAFSLKINKCLCAYAENF